ncbi:MAG TPA: hypothetical protein VGQ72_00520, partial [Pyrinomonadaceae bacterium]|nr:hypothetical protein [Pyrinomonadaceae bacterium]
MKLVRTRTTWPILTAGLCVGLVVVTSRIGVSQDQLPELVRRIKPSAVAIETFDARGEKLSRGSGFFVDVDRVV